MADFKEAQPYIDKNEGGYANVQGDTGGETMYGISRNNFPNWEGWKIVDANKPLVHGQVIDSFVLTQQKNNFYKENFWDKIHGDNITLQAVATFLYDWEVNAGKNAIDGVQECIGITEDGIIGNQTIQVINNDKDLLKQLWAERNNSYSQLVNKNQSLSKFLFGWLNRSNLMYKEMLNKYLNEVI